MSHASWVRPPFAIHVGVPESTSSLFEESARSAGASVIHLDLSAIDGIDTLQRRLSQTFLFPVDTGGLDSALDFISDLEWLGATDGYLVIVHGLDSSPEAIEPFASILPNIVDRWRSQGRPFVVLILGNESRQRALSVLADANLRMDNAGKLPWAQPGTGAVPILDHSGHCPGEVRALGAVMADRYVCPVCGYPALEEPPWTDDEGSDEICPSCGTHFGYHDAAGGDAARREEVYRRLRMAWRAGGCRWFSPRESPPPGWDPLQQLAPLEGR